MKITLQRAGGVVGYLPGLTNVPGHQPVSVETADLAPEQRAHIERLVEQAGLLGRREPAPRGYPGAERLITLEAGGKTHTAHFQEGDFPPAVQQLIEAVHSAAGQGGTQR